MIKINDALEASPNPCVVAQISNDVQAQLEAVSALYERVWWPEQEKQDQQWIAWATPLVAEYAPEVVPQLEENFTADGRRIRCAWT